VEVVWGVAFVCNRAPDADAGVAAWNEHKTRSFWAGQRIAIQIPEARKDSEHPSFVFYLTKKEKANGASDAYAEM
jgi:hypothetical protein